MRDYFKHDKATKLNALFLLQRQVLQKQIDFFQNFSFDSTSQDVTLSNFLLNKFETHRKIVDDFELTIMSLLDSSGKISTTTRLQDLMFLMTRVTKFDQRALCLRLLTDHVDTTLHRAFVEFGGFRLFKKWLQMAEEENCVVELKLIVSFCKDLPFHQEAVKDTLIGKSINKLLKYRSNNNSPDEIKDLYSVVTHLKTEWKNQIQALSQIANIEKGATETPPDADVFSSETLYLLDSINERLFSQQAQRSQHSNVDKPIIAVSTSSGDHNDPSVVELIETKDIIRQSSSEPTSPNTRLSSLPRAVVKPKLPVVIIEDTHIEDGKDSETKIVPSPVAISSEERKKKTAEEMRKRMNADKLERTVSGDATEDFKMDTTGSFLSEPTSPFQNYHPEDNSSSLRDSQSLNINSSSSFTTIMPHRMRNLIVKGVLKKTFPILEPIESEIQRNIDEPSSECLDGAMRNKSRNASGLRWADENGRELREVRTFEVAQMFSRVTKEYKEDKKTERHKNLAKKEKLLEKKARREKAEESMQTTVKWSRPAKRILSFEMQEYLCGPVESPAAELQTQRLSHVLMTRYFDESQIPPDPVESASVRESMIMVEEAPTEDVPWLIPDNPKDEELTQRLIKELQTLMNPVPVVDVYAILSQLEPEVSQWLSQNNQVDSIVFPDGSLNYSRIDEIRNIVFGPMIMYGQAPNSSYYEQSLHTYGSKDHGVFVADMQTPSFQGRRSRWSSPADNMVHQSPYHDSPGSTLGFNLASDDTSTLSWHNGKDHRGGENNFRNFGIMSDLGHYGPPPEDLQGMSMDFRPMGGHGSGYHGSGGGGGNRGFQDGARETRMESDRKRKMLHNKGRVPCKYFNTPKGCQFGAKCTFAHNDESGPTNVASRGSNQDFQALKKSRFDSTVAFGSSGKRMGGQGEIPPSRFVVGPGEGKDPFGRDLNLK